MNNATTRWLELARVDIKNQGDENDVDVMVVEGANYNIINPHWFSEGGVGYVIETCDRYLKLDLNCHGNGEIIIYLRGIDRRKSAGEKIPLWVDYTSFIVDGKEEFCETKFLWHDKPYTFTRKVQDGEIIRVEISWEPHAYKGEELAGLISQLGLGEIEPQVLRTSLLAYETGAKMENAKFSIDYLQDEIKNLRTELPKKEELKEKKHIYDSMEDLSNHIESGPFSIKISDVEFECFYHDNEKNVFINKKYLYVFFTSARGSNDPSPKSVRFSRWSYYPVLETMNGNLLCIDDPMIREYEIQDFTLGWFYGTKEKSYIKLSLEIVKAVCCNLHIPYENVIFFGSSSGGYCGIYAASFLKGSMAVAINPQIYIQKWMYARRFKEITGIDLKQKDYLCRNDLVSLIKNGGSKYVIIFNAMSDVDVDSQLTPFCNDMNIFPHYGLSDKGNVLLWIYSARGTNHPHVAFETRNIFCGIDSIAKSFHKGEKPEKMQDFAFLINRYWEEHYKLISTSSDSFITHIMDTARIDIKLKGSGINLKVSSTDMRALVTKPSWLQKNGEGYVITSCKKSMNLQLETVGDGKLEIMLKGPYVLSPNKAQNLIPYWVDYTSLKVDNVEILKEDCSVWHNKPFVFSMAVSGENTFNVDVSWKGHV